MEHRTWKNSLYEQIARLGKALSNSHRIELLDLLGQCERTVESLAAEAGLTVPNASQHLQVLKEARLVESRKEGLYVYYRLAGEGVARLVRDLQSLSRERLAEVDRLVRTYFEARDQLDPVTATELHRRMQEESILVLDVRPAEEYRAGHIPGAMSLPVHELERTLRDLPKDREIVAYCRGPFCVFAVEAVEMLRSRGFRARRLEEGLPDWRMRGFPVHEGH